MIDNIKFKNICYINRKEKDIKMTKLILILFTPFILLSYFIKYEVAHETYGYIVDENCNIKMNIYIEDIESITKSKEIIIADKQYIYKVANISEELYIDSNFKNYKEIKINIANRSCTLNKVVNLKIKTNEKRIIKIIIDYLFGKE
jgi:hypothetical protein